MDPKNGEHKKKLPSKGLQSSSIKFPSNVWYASLPITKKYNKICVNSLLEVIKPLLQIIIFALLNKVSELILQQSNFTARAQPHKIYLTADSRDSA